MRWRSPASSERNPVYDDQDRQRMQAEFDEWIGQMDSLIADLKAYVPETVAAKLDGSIESLLPLEAWLLETFETHTDLIADQDGRTMELLHPYLAKVFEKASGGRLEMGLDANMAYFAIPIIRFPKPRGNEIIGVATKATAAVHRKEMKMMYDLAQRWKATSPDVSVMPTPDEITPGVERFDAMLDAAVAEEEARIAKRQD